MKASTITPSTFTLAPSGGSPVAATVSYNATTNVATLRPSASLANGTTYAATLVCGGGGVTDSSGNPLASNITWTFTTAAAFTPGPPSVFIDSPKAGGTVSGTVSVLGWAVDNTSGIGTAIGSLQVLVDGAKVGNATYGLNRADVCAAYPGRPGCPNVGFSYSLNTATLSAGSHTLAVSATDTDNTPDTGSASVTIVVSATVLSTPPSVCIDVPKAGSTVWGL